MAERTPYDDERLVAARAAALPRGGVLSRPRLYELGVPRWLVRAELKANRWRALSDQAICLHNGPVEEQGQLWAAVYQGGPRARLDGVSALRASGLERFDADRIRVSVPRGARVRRTKLFDIRQTRRWRPEDVLGAGIPRTPPEVAAVHGALWAKSDRQAVLILTMAVQQKLTTPARLASRLLLIRRDRRRALLHATVLDLAGGVRALGEFDLLNGCRQRGLPLPETQVVRSGRSGRYYLDFRWGQYGVVVEVDGVQHAWVENLLADALRHNTVALDGDIVLRLPVMGLRVCPDEFFEQIAIALRSRGWDGLLASA